MPEWHYKPSPEWAAFLEKAKENAERTRLEIAKRIMGKASFAV